MAPEMHFTLFKYFHVEEECPFERTTNNAVQEDTKRLKLVYSEQI